MKNEEIIKEAFKIGRDSYELQHFMQLNKRVGIKKQIEALKQDQVWQQDHHDEISGCIDILINKLEND